MIDSRWISVEARSSPEYDATKKQQNDCRYGQEHSWPPMERHQRSPRHGCKYDEDTCSAGNQRPVQQTTWRPDFSSNLLSLHAGFDIVFGNAVALGFATRSFPPLHLLFAASGRKGNGS